MSASEREIRKHLVREIVDYTVAIRRDPQDADAYLNRGVAYENQGEYEPRPYASIRKTPTLITLEGLHTASRVSTSGL